MLLYVEEVSMPTPSDLKILSYFFGAFGFLFLLFAGIRSLYLTHEGSEEKRKEESLSLWRAAITLLIISAAIK